MKVYSPKEFWSAYAVNHPKAWNKDEQYKELRNLLGWIRKYLWPDATILDVGSGWGRFVQFCQAEKLPNPIQMVDIADTYINQAFETTGQRPDQWNGQTLPYEANSFDLVVAQSVLLHVKPAMLDRVWNELIRVSDKFVYVATSYPAWTIERWAEDHKPGCWCFAHDYYDLIRKSRLTIIEEYHPGENRIAWLLQKS
jgi:ubiquinone/menaquinone biosynthesis C-methylase UbiE